MNEFIKKPVQTRKEVFVKKIKSPDGRVVDEVINSGVPTAKISAVTSEDATSRVLRVQFDYLKTRIMASKDQKKTKKDVTFTFPSKPGSDGKVVEAFYDGKSFPLYFAQDKQLRIQNHASFYQQEVIVGLLLSAQVLEDQNYATAVTELFREARILSAVQGELAPYMIKLRYKGTTTENKECTAEGILNADGNIVGMNVWTPQDQKTRYRYFSVFGAIPIITRHDEKTSLLCDVYHKSMRTWLARETLVETNQSFTEQADGIMGADEKNAWKSKEIFGERCGASTYSIQACNGTVKASFLEETDIKTPLGNFGEKATASFECRNLVLEKMEIGAFVSPDVVTKAVQRPLFGHSPLP